MKRTRQEAEQTHQDILNAGLIVFGNKGVEQATVDEIAKKANVTRGAFYYHFKNKFVLYENLLKLRAEAYREVIDESFIDDLSPIKRIRKYMINILMKVARDDRFRALNEMILHKSMKIDEILETMKENEMERLIPTRIFIDTVDEGRETGEIFEETSTGFAVMAIFIFIQGTIIFRMLNRDRFSMEERAEGLVDTFLLGISER